MELTKEESIMKKILSLFLAAAIALPLAANAGCDCCDKKAKDAKEQANTALNEKTDTSKKSTAQELIDANKKEKEVASEIDKGSSDLNKGSAELNKVKKVLPKTPFTK